MNRGLASLHATTLVGAGSIVTLALSVIAMKAYALLVGPDGVGIYALLLAISNLGVLVVSVGLQSGTTTAVAEADGRGNRGTALAIATTAFVMALTAGTLGAATLVLLRDPIAAVMLGAAERSQDVAFVALALTLTVGATVGAAALIGIHQLKAVTLIAIITAIGAALFGVALVGTIGSAGFAPSMAAAAAVQLTVTTYAMRRAGIRLSGFLHLLDWGTARSLMNLGVPVAFSQALAGGAMLLVPVLVLHALGSAEVGYYRAALAVSVGLGSVFIAGVHQDFLPRIAGTAGSAERVMLIERRMRIVIGIALPILLVLIGLGPFVLDLLYSTEFRPALAVLQWQLVGDMVRLPAMVVATAALAIRSRAAFFGLEALNAAMIVGGTLAGISVLGLAGVGVAYAVAQIVTYVAAWHVARRRFGVVPGRLQVVVIATLVGTSVVLALEPSGLVRAAIFLSAALMMALVAWYRLGSLHRAEEL